jgi:hypothetical protein
MYLLIVIACYIANCIEHHIKMGQMESTSIQRARKI